MKIQKVEYKMMIFAEQIIFSDDYIVVDENREYGRHVLHIRRRQGNQVVCRTQQGS